MFTPMHNDPELSGKYLGTISQDFVKVSDILKEASYQIRKAGFEFPIFPISKESQPVGQLLIDKGSQETQWFYYASFLDEFVQRELVAPDRLEDFEKRLKIRMSSAVFLWSIRRLPILFSSPFRRINSESDSSLALILRLRCPAWST
jgi:hypothetical protein